MTERMCLAAIKAAGLAAPTYRTARELLDLAARQKGVTRISMGLLCEIAETQSEGTARRHLIELRAAGIIGYNIEGEAITVSFSAWSVITQRAYTRVQRAAEPPQPDNAPVENGLPKDHAARVEDHAAIFSTNGHVEPPPQLVGCLVVNQPIPTNGNGINNQPNNQTHAPAREPDPAAAAIATPSEVVEEPPAETPPGSPLGPDEKLTRDEPTVDLLIAVGIKPPKARALAATCGFGEALRQIGAWMPEYQVGKTGTGLLVKRIEERWGAPPISDAFRQSAFYRDHVPYGWGPEGAPRYPVVGVTIQTDANFYEAEPEPSPTPPIPTVEPPTDELAEAWKIAQWEARNSRSLGESLWGPLQAANLEAAGDVDGIPLYRVILLAGSDRATLENRMAVWVRKTLSSLLKHKCLVEFVLAGGAQP